MARSTVEASWLGGMIGKSLRYSIPCPAIKEPSIASLLFPLTHCVNSNHNGLRGELVPGHMDAHLVDVAIDEAQWKIELPLQHISLEVQVAENCISTPKRHLKRNKG